MNPESDVRDKELAAILRDPDAYLERLDFSVADDRQRAVELAVVLANRFVLPNADVGTEDYEREDPPGGYHFIPERWVGPDEDAASDVDDELTRRDLPTLTAPPSEDVIEAIESVDGVLTAREDALSVYRSWVGGRGQLAMWKVLFQLGSQQCQGGGPAQSETEFIRLVPLLSKNLPRRLIYTLSRTLFELSATSAVVLTRSNYGPLVSAALAFEEYALDDH